MIRDFVRFVLSWLNFSAFRVFRVFVARGSTPRSLYGSCSWELFANSVMENRHDGPGPAKRAR
jgi:hypothetical protein